MKTVENIITSLIVSLLSTTAFAQESSYDKDYRVPEKVALMNAYISNIADKKNTKKTRWYYRTKALNLFIGKGYEYVENDIQKEGVIMQITSKKKGSSVKCVDRKGIVY